MLEVFVGGSVANPIILIVGRLSGPKNDVILSILRNVAPKVVRAIPGARFQVVGGPVAEEHLKLEREFPYIQFEGHQTNLKFFYQRAAVVVGAGRVALEAMALKKPVVAVGERMYLGPMLPAKVEQAKATNFGDCWSQEVFDWPQMAKDLTALLKNPKTRAQAAQTGYELVQSEYNLETLYPQMEKLYGQVLLKKDYPAFMKFPS
jgi:glycosyltransferase involved in cell wall biosynthesis